MGDTARSDLATCDRFLGQMLAHHRQHDDCPDAKVIGAELHSPPALTEAVVQDVRAKVWIARSPHATDRIRITAWGWQHLKERDAAPVPH